MSAIASSTPGMPGGHGMRAPGIAANAVATPAIQLAGSHARHASSHAMGGATEASTQAPRPTTVAIGAAGAASRFATTP